MTMKIIGGVDDIIDHANIVFGSFDGIIGHLDEIIDRADDIIGCVDEIINHADDIIDCTRGIIKHNGRIIVRHDIIIDSACEISNLPNKIIDLDDENYRPYRRTYSPS